MTVAKGSLNIARAAGGSVTGEDSDSDHRTAAKSVEDQADESEESLAAQAACKDDGADGVKDCRTGETLNGLLPAGNGDITVSLHGEEVRVDSKDDCSATKFEGIKRRRDEFQSSTAESHCGRSGDSHGSRGV